MSAISICPHERSRFIALLEVQLAGPGQHLIHRQVSRGRRQCRRHCILDYRQQFALQRSMIARRPFAKSRYNIIGCVLDRQVYRHRSLQICSNMEQN
jgi:hypothetical protein